jgi:hypothetical protein
MRDHTNLLNPFLKVLFRVCVSSPSKRHPKKVIPANSDEEHSQSTLESKKGIGGGEHHRGYSNSKGFYEK